jgi:hypothetical protein
MGTPDYDDISPPLVEKLKTQPGFMYHVAFVDSDGRFTVSEIWASQKQHDHWFNENVKPNVPGIDQEVIEVTPSTRPEPPTRQLICLTGGWVGAEAGNADRWGASASTAPDSPVSPTSRSERSAR